jgi:hypothetical protein
LFVLNNFHLLEGGHHDFVGGDLRVRQIVVLFHGLL